MKVEGRRRSRWVDWRPGIVFALTLLALVSLPIPGFGERSLAPFGPALRGEDGRFDNPDRERDHGSFAVRFPFFMRRIGGAFRSRPGAPAVLPNAGRLLRDRTTGEGARVTWVGHASLLVQMDRVAFLTDPIWSDTPSPVRFAGPRRFVSPGIELEDLPEIDFVLISHNHYDHLDLPTLVDLSERDPETIFFVPLGNAELLRGRGIENVVELDWGGTVQLGDVVVHCLPSQHWSKRGIGDDHKSLWSSWAVIGDERRFFFAGDTGYFDGFARISSVLGAFDFAAVPIGAYRPVEMMKSSHMNPEEAVKAAIDLRATQFLAIHFGTFDLADEPLDEPPRRFREAAFALGLGPERAWLLKIGETRDF